MGKGKERVWPTLNDEESARRTAERAARVTTLWALTNFALGIVMTLSGTKVIDRHPIYSQGSMPDNGDQWLSGSAFLISGCLFGLIAWKIRRMSRGWTLGGTILAMFLFVGDFIAAPSLFVLIALGTVLAYFVNAVRAVYYFDRVFADQPTSFEK